MKTPRLVVALSLAALLPALSFAEPVVYDLTQEPYSPYLTKTKTVIWRNCRLSDLYGLSGEMKGGWISKGKQASALLFDRTETQCTAQFQAADGHCKIVQAHFEQSGDDIVGWVEKAGYVDGGYYGKIVPSSQLGNANLSYDGTTGGYGIHLVQKLGDVVQTVEELPAAPEGIAITGGVLQVNVADDMVVTQKVMGTGGLRFTGDGQVRSKSFSFDKFLTTGNQVVCYDAWYLDLAVESGDLNGGWVTATPKSLKPYNATTNLTERSITLQMQGKDSKHGNRYGIIVRFAQDGSNVVAKAISTRQAGEGHELGSDMATWTGVTASIATSATASGYGVESMVLVRRSLPSVTFTGEKLFKGGVTADGCLVRIDESALPDNTHARAINGGHLQLAVKHDFGKQPGNTYYIGPESEISTWKAYAIAFSDDVTINGGTLRQVNSNIYVDRLTLVNGARVEGSIDIGSNVTRDPQALWTSSGETENTVDAICRIIKIIASPFVIQADADIRFKQRMEEYVGDEGKFAGMNVVKKGAGKAILEAGLDTTGRVTMVEGTLELGGTSTIGPLKVEGASTLTVAEGGSVSFGDSSAQAWTEKVQLNLFGAFGETDKTMRFGTSSSGLTHAQLRSLRANGFRCTLDDEGYLHERHSGFSIFLR